MASRGAALITGGARRIGRALAIAAADAGYDVAIHVRSVDDEAEAAAGEVRARGRKAAIFACDLRQEGATAPLIGQAESELGPITLLVNSANRLHQDIATVMQQGLQRVGVEVELRTVEFQTLLQQHKARDYDAVISNWTLDTFKVDPTPLFTCAEARIPGSANRAGFCDPAVDALIERGLRSTDPAEGKATWAEFSRALQEHQPLTFLFWREDLAGVGSRVENVETDVRSKIVNLQEWWIPESRRR